MMPTIATIDDRFQLKNISLSRCYPGLTI